ncbi:hypothetical protein EU537_12500 [Candidatus Thorarchaeota archaeon]|nr:MAG: hypothetical protein EU537_12500 [Candidatus Thorarchaeota archaeon]
MKHVRLILAILISIAVVAAITVTTYGWILGQTIYQSTYSAKAGVDYWATWTLENNIFYASILLAVLSIITLPQRSTFISFVSALSQTGPVVKRLKLSHAIIWRIIEFGGLLLFYISSGGYSVTGQNVAFLMMLTGDGSIALSQQNISTLFSLPFYPGTPSDAIIQLMPALEAYQLYVGLIATFIVFTAGRIGLSIAADFMAPRRDSYAIISKALFIVSLIVVLEILSVPMWTANAGTWMSYLALIISLAAALIGALAFLVMRLHAGDAYQRLQGKIQQLEENLARLQGELISVRSEYESGSLSMEEYRRRVSMLMEDRANISKELRRLKLERLLPIGTSPRKFGLLAAILIVMVVLLPVIQGFYYGIQMQGDKYIEWKFNYETRKEIAITNWAAGVTDIEQLTIDDLISNATPESEVEFLTTVRQWDQEASYLRMKNQIGTNWMQLAGSDIVYLNGQQYWIAPLTFDYGTISTSFINQRLIYTHTEGIVILDAYSGDIVEDDALVALFNRTEPVTMYYGEGTGFRGPVFPNVPSVQEIGNNSFQGTPDYKLQGFESFYYMLTQGPEAWSFLGQEMDILIERNVLSRVQNVLLQGLRADNDPYIVVAPDGTFSYAVSIYVDYRLATAYAHEKYMRFMGVALVDIENGDIEFYSQPLVNSSFFIDQTFVDHYDWQQAPDWLQRQMKWPEDLYERQLDVAYIYHVTDGFLWKGGNDFHESPEGSDTRYIVMRIGGLDRFVAIHNSEFLDSAGRNLAGLYTIGCGNKDFGKLQFYSASSQGFSTLLGPNAAVQAFETNEDVRTQLQLWGDYRYGNRLIYHLGGDLFFVVPVFLVVETSTDRVIQKLGGVGLVDAGTGERVTLGENVIEAYYKMFGLLNRSIIGEGEVGIENAAFNPLTIESGELSQLSMILRNNDNTEHNLTVDITVAAGNFSVFWHGAEVSPIANPSNTTFSLNIGTVGSGDYYGTTPSLTAYLPDGIVSAQYLVVVTLRTEDGIEDQLSLILTIT